MTLVAQIALWLSLLVGVWGAVVGFVGRERERPDLALSARRAVFVLCGLLLLDVAILEYLIFTHDFNVEYVASYTSRNLPTFYLWSAIYAGQKGSLLFWATVLSIFGSLALLLTPSRYRALLPAVAGVVCAVSVFFLVVMLFAANPFERLAFTPADGRGMNPQLQNPGMVFHPPMLYLGYVSITIPFGFAIAALVTKQLDTGWIHAIRKWTLVSWLFLSCGIILGMWWAYVELGWGGYWAWDPVENASFLPWLLMTAFLHSVMIQEKRGMLKKWNLGLIIGAWLLSILGTFITRSGVISSVHSFTQSPVGAYFLGFLILAGTASFILLYTRLPLLAPEAQLESMVSREAMFLFNNLLLVGAAFSILWGTLFPILSEAVRGTKVTVGPPFFNQVNVPIGLALLLVTGIGPLIAWRQASTRNLARQFAAPATALALTLLACWVAGMSDGYAMMAIAIGAFVAATVAQEFWRGTRARARQYHEGPVLALARLVGRNRRRYGGYVVHLGIVVLFIAFAGMAFKRETEATLRPGESVTLRSPYGHTYRLTHLGVSQYEALNRFVTAASFQVERDGRPLGVMKSEKRQHRDSFDRDTFEPSTEVAIRSDLREDLYAVFAGAVNGTEQAVYRFTINPLVWWVWYGGMVVVLGGLIVMWPSGGGTGGVGRREQAGYAVKIVEEAK